MSGISLNNMYVKIIRKLEERKIISGTTVSSLSFLLIILSYGLNFNIIYSPFGYEVYLYIFYKFILKQSIFT